MIMLIERSISLACVNSYANNTSIREGKVILILIVEPSLSCITWK